MQTYLALDENQPFLCIGNPELDNDYYAVNCNHFGPVDFFDIYGDELSHETTGKILLMDETAL